MLFQELNKLKWNTVMTAVILITLGIFMIICPEPYIKSMIGLMGAILLILAVLGIFDFLSSNKALIHYIYLTGWLFLMIIGSMILFFEFDALYTISWLFGAVLILGGVSNGITALSYSRRAGRKGWWVLLLLSLLQIGCGLVVLLNPWWDTPGKLFKVVGVMILFSSAISALRLIWSWPVKAE